MLIILPLHKRKSQSIFLEAVTCKYKSLRARREGFLYTHGSLYSFIFGGNPSVKSEHVTLADSLAVRGSEPDIPFPEPGLLSRVLVLIPFLSSLRTPYVRIGVDDTTPWSNATCTDAEEFMAYSFLRS